MVALDQGVSEFAKIIQEFEDYEAKLELLVEFL
jgi:hypothetical protein